MWRGGGREKREIQNGFILWCVGKYDEMVMSSLNQRCPLNQFSRPKAVRQSHYDERDLSFYRLKLQKDTDKLSEWKKKKHTKRV